MVMWIEQTAQKFQVCIDYEPVLSLEDAENPHLDSHYQQ